MTDTAPLPPSYAGITPLDPEWLWDGNIAYGTLTGLFGPEGIAKGFLECLLASIVTNGETLPGNKEAVNAGSVIMITTEDDANTTLAWRLRAANAKLDKVYDMTEVNGGQFSIPESLPALREAIAQIGDVRLVIMDPLGDLSSIGLTSSVVKMRRTITNPLIKLAEDTGVAILLTQHTNKDGKVLQGSAAIRQALRSLLRVTRDGSNPTLRIVSVDKANNASDSTAHNVRYTLTGSGKDTRAVFLGADSESAEDVTWHDYSDAEIQEGWSREAGQSAIVKVLRDAVPHTMRAGDIASKVGTTYIATRVLLRKLAKHGDVIEQGKGNWTVPNAEGSEAHVN